MTWIKPPQGQRLPDIVTVAEAERLVQSTRVMSYRVLFFTLYSLGLRLGEGLRLTVADIDAARQRVHIRDSKGNKDRLVPLPDATLALLRSFWRVHRHPVLLFPNRKGGLKGAASAPSPLAPAGVQITLRKVAESCGIKKDHPALPASLCNSPDRGRRRPVGGTEDPRPPFHSHHRSLHPPDQPHWPQRRADH